METFYKILSCARLDFTLFNSVSVEVVGRSHLMSSVHILDTRVRVSMKVDKKQHHVLITITITVIFRCLGRSPRRHYGDGCGGFCVVLRRGGQPLDLGNNYVVMVR